MGLGNPGLVVFWQSGTGGGGGGGGVSPLIPGGLVTALSLKRRILPS